MRRLWASAAIVAFAAVVATVGAATATLPTAIGYASTAVAEIIHGNGSQVPSGSKLDEDVWQQYRRAMTSPWTGEFSCKGDKPFALGNIQIRQVRGLFIEGAVIVRDEKGQLLTFVLRPHLVARLENVEVTVKRDRGEPRGIAQGTFYMVGHTMDNFPGQDQRAIDWIKRTEAAFEGELRLYRVDGSRPIVPCEVILRR